jgi:hypothetical protein
VYSAGRQINDNQNVIHETIDQFLVQVSSYLPVAGPVLPERKVVVVTTTATWCFSDMRNTISKHEYDRSFTFLRPTDIYTTSKDKRTSTGFPNGQVDVGRKDTVVAVEHLPRTIAV